MEAHALPRSGGIFEALEYLGRRLLPGEKLSPQHHVMWCWPNGLLGLGADWPAGSMPLLVARGAALQVVLDNAAEIDVDGHHWVPQMPEDEQDEQALLRFRDASILVLMMLGQNDLGWLLSPLGQESLAILEQRGGKLPDLNTLPPTAVAAAAPPPADDVEEEPIAADLKWAVVLAPMPDAALAERIGEHCWKNVSLANYTVLDVVEQVPAAEFRFRWEGDARLFRLKFGGQLRCASPVPATSGDGWPDGLRPVILSRQEDPVDSDEDVAEEGIAMRVEDAGSIAVWNLAWEVRLTLAPAPAELARIAEHLAQAEVETADYAAVLSEQTDVLPGVYRFRHEDHAQAFVEAFGGAVRDLKPADPRQGQLFAA